MSYFITFVVFNVLLTVCLLRTKFESWILLHNFGVFRLNLKQSIAFVH